ncbi:MAG TPA: Pycsar system effector family protein [Candidatus Bathyarchaeia archaeon]|nr:Pycsar system effector family protein [Candidatus Bathyarchaeia archaeon]
MSQKDTMTNDLKFEAMKTIFDQNYQLISLADNKATAILTVNGILLTVVLAMVGLLGGFFIIENKLDVAVIVLFGLYVLSCLVSIIFSILTISPFQKTGIPDKRHIFYYVNILEHETKEEYNKGLTKVLDDFSLLQKEFSDQIYSISKVNQRKYKYVKWCIWTLLVSLIIIGGFLTLTILR